MSKPQATVLDRRQHTDGLSGPEQLRREHQRLITMAEVANRVTLHRVTIWRMVKDGKFPKPIHLTGSRVAWREATIDEWITDRQNAA